MKRVPHRKQERRESLKQVQDRVTRRYLKMLLRTHDGCVATVALIAGIRRCTVYRAMDRLGIPRRAQAGKWDREIDISAPTSRGNCSRAYPRGTHREARS